MKAERRHELQTNALADWLSKTIEQVKPHANSIIIGALLAVVAIAAVVYLSGRSGQGSAQAWGEYYQAVAIEDADKRITELGKVAKSHAQTAPGMWARLMAGDARLLRGANAQFKNRSQGQEDLDKAQLDFESVIKEAQALPAAQRDMLLQRANWGLAQTFDALAMGEDAAEQYQKLADAWPDSALGEAAAEKARNLKHMSDWFEWYASVDPSAIERSATRGRTPPGGIPGGFPFPPRDRELPDDPDFNLPGPLSLPGPDDLGFDLRTGDSTATSEDDSPPSSIFTENENTPADEGGGGASEDQTPPGETTPEAESGDAPVEPAAGATGDQP